MPDWSQRYRDRHTPWDLGEAHPELRRRLAAGELTPPQPGSRALVPGCGRGWDAFALAEAGWEVVALDLVADLGAAIDKRLAPAAGRFLAVNALDLAALEEAGLASGGFDLLWDHTFFCALEPATRPDFGRLASWALKPTASLCSLVFPVGRPVEQGGPPFAMSPDDLELALGPDFRLRCNEIAILSASDRAWAERWCRFERIITKNPSGATQNP